jgi:acetyltransferase-like isoleucine patch superfamily enzyme
VKKSFGLRRKIRLLLAYFNLILFQIRKVIFGFEVANLFIQKVDKISIQMILKKNGASIGENCDIESGLIFHNCADYHNFIVGNNCHIGKNSFFDLRDKILICNNVVISMQVTFLTHIDISKSPLSAKFPSISQSITVNDGAYIGTNSTILMGVSLGKESFVAAGAVVRDSVNNNMMVGGVPAKTIRAMTDYKIPDF